MLEIFKSAKFWIGVGCFAGGLFVSSKTAKKIAVKGMATGMKAKDGIVAGWNNIKEEAEDIYEEAKEKAASEADDEAIKPAPVQNAAKAAKAKKPAKQRK